MDIKEKLLAEYIKEGERSAADILNFLSLVAEAAEQPQQGMMNVYNGLPQDTKERLNSCSFVDGLLWLRKYSVAKEAIQQQMLQSIPVAQHAALREISDVDTMDIKQGNKVYRICVDNVEHYHMMSEYVLGNFHGICLGDYDEYMSSYTYKYM